MIARLPIRAMTILLVLLVTGGTAHAGDDLIPSKQAALLLRSLLYDRNVRQRATDAVTVAVVYREGNTISKTYELDMTAALRDLARGSGGIRNLPVRIISIGYSSSERFEEAVAHHKPTALYVCPALGDALDSIAEVSRRYKSLSFSGRENEVREGMSIGLLRRGTRPALIVNLPAAVAEGALLEPDLLALSEVLR